MALSVRNTPALVKIKACRRPDDKPLSEPMVVSLLTYICLSRPQCVNVIVGIGTDRHGHVVQLDLIRIPPCIQTTWTWTCAEAAFALYIRTEGVTTSLHITGVINNFVFKLQERQKTQIEGLWVDRSLARGMHEVRRIIYKVINMGLE